MHTQHTKEDLIAKAVPTLLAVANQVGTSRLDHLTDDAIDALTLQISGKLYPIVEEIRSGNQELRLELQSMLSDVVQRGQIQQRMITQPQGYAGDYLTLDWLYQQPYEGNRHDDVWNRFCYRQQASRAVRSRIDIVRDLILDTVKGASGPVHLLDVASGPGRIERTVIDRLGAPIHPVHIDLVDADADAVEYATALLADEVPPGYHFSFHHRNAFRYEPTVSYDAIWCCGLFDYLDHRLAVRLMRKFYNWLKPGGTLLVGNFARECATQWIMEGLYGWQLIYRTNDDCLRIAHDAGIPANNIRLERDATGSVVLVRGEKGG